MALQRIDHADDHMQECIDNCLEAAQVCEWCVDACADEEGMGRCIRLCRDVADVASLHARLMARDSGSHEELGELCADLCEACAEECEQHEHEHCQACAEILPRCAESCREMASA
ncbi:four-helix bundle copper-binding protein [Halobiforma nitratireducens]|uniref:Four-helix bundle copper-binding protein n=1 Tax=Halobiforma nitratireducens JCM 10879 TaxID=1227454 RepID=M0LLN7_9EURY|nr:four-helix bundle copper-binding protein [Halobiforma nitratireducens]EMA33374.1 hypothetical protein C446_14129 [Halobiforma nitratireducens JCM 10879]